MLQAFWYCVSVAGARIKVLGKKIQCEEQTSRILQPLEVKRLLRFVCMYVLIVIKSHNV